MNQAETIGKEFYLIRSKERDFHRNLYLKRFIHPEKGQKNMLFDPGTRLDLPALQPALDQLIGGIKNIDFIFLSHQDPDVTANVPMLMASAPRAMIIASIDTWRLIKMYGIPQNRFIATEGFHKNKVRIRETQHTIHFLPASFAHFKGAMMLFDPESGVLFTGDFLAGVNTQKTPETYATEDSWAGIALFHQIYMPGKAAIEQAVGRIADLPDIPRVIAPQHGNLIRGEFIRSFLERIHTIDVGLDLLTGDQNPKEMTLLAVNSFIDTLKDLFPELHRKIVQTIAQPGDFTTLAQFVSGTFVELKVSPDVFVDAFIALCRQLLTPDEYTHIEGVMANAWCEFGLELPKSDVERAPDFPADLLE